MSKRLVHLNSALRVLGSNYVCSMSDKWEKYSINMPKVKLMALSWQVAVLVQGEQVAFMNCRTVYYCCFFFSVKMLRRGACALWGVCWTFSFGAWRSWWSQHCSTEGKWTYGLAQWSCAMFAYRCLNSVMMFVVEDVVHVPFTCL